MLPGDLYQIQAASAQIQNHRQGEEFWTTCAAPKTLSPCPLPVHVGKAVVGPNRAASHPT